MKSFRTGELKRTVRTDSQSVSLSAAESFMNRCWTGSEFIRMMGRCLGDSICAPVKSHLYDRMIGIFLFFVTTTCWLDSQDGYWFSQRGLACSLYQSKSNHAFVIHLNNSIYGLTQCMWARACRLRRRLRSLLSCPPCLKIYFIYFVGFKSLAVFFCFLFKWHCIQDSWQYDSIDIMGQIYPTRKTGLQKDIL